MARLKEIIEDGKAIPADESRLVFAGKQLEDRQTLLDCKVENHSFLHLVLRMTGGGAMFADVSNSSSLMALKFSTTAPEWRMATFGLNVEGKCSNRSCCAYQQMVIDMKGMVSWSLLADKAHCPMCKQQFQPVTCAFTGCTWTYDGRKSDISGAPVDVEGSWQEVSGDSYSRFQ